MPILVPTKEKDRLPKWVEDEEDPDVSALTYPQLLHILESRAFDQIHERTSEHWSPIGKHLDGSNDVSLLRLGEVEYPGLDLLAV